MCASRLFGNSSRDDGIFSVIENIFETFLDWKEDPLKTLVAIEELRILSERIENFSQILKEKLKQDGFNL